jgi:hypothetical protein
MKTLLLTGVFYVLAQDYEKEGKPLRNYLLQQGNYLVAYSTEEVLADTVWGRMEVTCDSAYKYNMVGEVEPLFICIPKGEKYADSYRLK